MNLIQKKLRYYYWLIISFISKNWVSLVISTVLSFFAISFFINSYPSLNSLLLKKKITVGIIGKYSLQNIPLEISSLMSSPLVSYNEKGDLTPILANSWELYNDNKTYRFHIKTNLYWDNGKRFTAKDLNYNFEGIQTKVIDDNTIDFYLNQPLSIFPAYLTKPVIKYPLIGIGGLYQVQNFNLKSKYYVTEINLYPNKKDLAYKTFKFYDNENDLIVAFKKGEITEFQTIKKNLADKFKDWKNVTYQKQTDFSQIMTLFINTQSNILNSKDLRKSLSYSVPDFSDLGVKANGPISPLSWAYDENLKTYQFDKDKARKIITDEISATQSAEINFYTFFDYIGVAERLKLELQDVGFKVNLHILSYIPADFDILLTLWNPPVDPDQYYFWHSTQTNQNITNLKNVKIDKLLEDGRKVTNVTERKQIYTDLQKVIIDEVPAIFLYYPSSYTISRK
ncbi:hypothetical protein A3J15_01355 [Candidatus Roizmanbacteria bacterium RIFCSPLOWO2_02_FULL_38_10]|uniref:Solute-binding protein family 5 domain-containing protein n=1 Tax=Candidatus Roizmanbacteria bacterium RIFCSPLOWO2_02_FULL_38_10 TaxID=1802074 RepID=A0A1F7JP44_9BACT|nr:MAG: hypothetical protein A3J15_01355 [Candidatus Roizmanbacteria bacterium RIFCSPLOWO2_02_FULL_38_10]